MNSSEPEPGLFRPLLSLLTGTALANLIAVFGTPVLTRLYSPDAFGVYAVYTGVIAVAALLAGWRYDVGIVLPEDDAEATRLLEVALILAGLSSLVLGVALLVARAPLSRAAGAPELSNWLLLAPIHVFVAAAYAALTYSATRRGGFNRIAATRVAQSSTGLLCRVAMAAARPASFVGLIIGQFVGDLFAAALIAKNVVPALRRRIRTPPRPVELWKTAIEHRSLAIHTLSTNFLNAAATFLLPFLVAYHFDAFSAGLVMMAQRAISMPFLMLTSSLWQVAHAQLARRPDAERRSLFSYIHRLSSLIHAFPLTFLALYPQIAVMIFGPDWSPIARIVPAIAAMVYFSSVANSTSYFVAFGLYGWDSAANVVLFAARMGAILIGAKVTDFHGTILMYCLSSVVVYFCINVGWSIYFRRTTDYLAYLLCSPIAAALLLAPLVYYASSVTAVVLLTAPAAGLYYYAAWRLTPRRRSGSLPHR